MNRTRKQIIIDIEDGITFGHVDKYIDELELLKASIAWIGCDLIDVLVKVFGDEYRDYMVSKFGKQCEERMKEL